MLRPRDGRRWRWSWWAVLALVLGCPTSRDAAPLPPPIAELEDASPAPVPHPDGEPAPHVVVALSVADRGELLPCSCPDGIAGGWARKATLLGGLGGRGQPMLAVAGPESLVSGTTDPTRTLGAVEGAAARSNLLGAAGIEIVALGAADIAALSAAQLVEAASRSEVSWVATNLRRPDGSNPLSTVHVEDRGGYRVAVLSVMEPGAAALPRGEFTLEDPATAVAAALESLPSRPDAVIAFSDAADAVLMDVASRLRGVDFVVGIAGQGAAPGVVLEDGVRLIRAEPGGKQLGFLDLVFAGERGAPFSDDARVRDIASQRLVALVDEARHAEPRGAGPGPRRAELDRELPVGVVDGHGWAYRGAALMADLPEDEGIRSGLSSF